MILLLNMLAYDYVNKDKKPLHNASGWYLSEKFDGQRGIWENGIMYSRNGNEILTPQWLKDLLIGIKSLDGELYFGKNSFHRTGAFRKKSVDLSEWENVKYMIFDIPDSKEVFSERYTKLGIIVNSLDKTNSHYHQLKLVNQKKISNHREINNIFSDIVQNGGEGVILKDPNGLYKLGRSNSFLKYKIIQDNEAIIVGYKMGKGKYTNMLGAFMAHPIEKSKPNPKKAFSLSGINDYIRKNYFKTHPIGTIITYTYNGLTKNGKPRHPCYKGIRIDVITNLQPKTKKKIIVIRKKTKKEIIIKKKI